MRSKPPLIRQIPDHCPDKSALEATSHQTNSRPLSRQKCARSHLSSDKFQTIVQTKVRSKPPLIRQIPDHCPDKSALEATSHQTNSRPLSRQKCARSHLSSDKFQTIVQTKVRSKLSPGHVISAHLEHACVRIWSDQRSLRSVHLDLGSHPP